MASPLARCPNCKLVFESRVISMLNARDATLSGNRESCPNCGSMADILDGVFNASAEAMEIVKAPKFTREIYIQFGQLVEQAESKQMDPDEFVHRAEAIAPEFGEAARKIASSRMGYAVALGILLVMLKSCNFNVDVSFDVNKAIETYFERSDREQIKKQ